MNVAVQTAQPAAPPLSYTVSAFFKDESAVTEALQQCLHRGIPRDLIDVAVSEAAAPHFFGGRAGRQRDGWFSWTGRGALAGLIISAILTLLIVLIPGFNMSRLMAMVQLLGPDIGILIGALLGALYGWFRPGDVRQEMLRATERADAVLLLVHLQPAQEAQAVAELLATLGAEDVLSEPDNAASVGAE